MALKKLPFIGDNAFESGFLSKQWTEPVIKRLNLLGNMSVVTTDGVSSGAFVVTENNIILTLDLNSQSANQNPFSVIGSVADAGGLQVMVSPGGTLLQSIDQTDTITVTGLDEWKAISAGSHVYLDVNTTSLAAQIKVGLWPNYPQPIGWVNPSAVDKVQNRAYLSLGVLKLNPAATPITNAVSSFDLISGDNRYSFYQLVNTNLMLAQTCYPGGSNVLFPMPWHGAIIV